MTSASEEIARRRAVRSSLREWARLNGFEPAAHHLLLIDRLEKVARGEIRKLMFFLPPGSAKTTYRNLFVPWYMSQVSGRSVLGASHTTEMATRFRRRIRSMVQTHGTTLGIGLNDDTQAADHWRRRMTVRTRRPASGRRFWSSRRRPSYRRPHPLA